MTDIDQMEFFHQATMRVCGSLDLNQVLSDSLLFFEPYIPLDGISVSIIEENSPRVRFIAAKTKKGFRYRFPRMPVELDDTALKAIESLVGEPVTLVHNMAEALPCRAVVRHMGSPVLSGMVLTLKIEDRLIATVTVIAEGLNRYNTHHAALLTLLQGPFSVSLSNTLKHQELKRYKDLLAEDNQELKDEIRLLTDQKIIGEEGGLKEIMDMVRQVAALSSQVLIQGETGVGKEVIANAIHYTSDRVSGPFVKVNCGAIPESLIDSELFGHEQGAFTGATARKRGKFERADHGTIFLDEIGELPLQAQVRLLRVIQNKEIERIGGNRTIPLDIRIIAATNRNLEDMVKKGTFREDLWYRLNVFPIRIPPLRHRRTDIPDMVRYFFHKKAREMNIRAVPLLSDVVLAEFSGYDWPGNVRELENVVERSLIRGTFERFSSQREEALPAMEPPSAGDSDSPSGSLNLDEVVKHHIQGVLTRVNGKIYGPGGAAQAMGVHPSTLRNRMDRLGISYRRRSKTVTPGLS